MATTAGLLASLARTKRRIMENLAAKGVVAEGSLSLLQLMGKVLEVPSSAPAVAISPETIAIPEGPFSSALLKLAQAREALRQNLGAKGIDVTGVTALSTLAEQIRSISSTSGEVVPIPIMHVDWTTTNGLDEFTGTPYQSYWELNGNDNWFPLSSIPGTEPDSQCVVWGLARGQVCAKDAFPLYLFPGSYRMIMRRQLPVEVANLQQTVRATLYHTDGQPETSQEILDHPLGDGEIYNLSFEDLTIEQGGYYRAYFEGEVPENLPPEGTIRFNIYSIELDRMDASTTAYATTDALAAAITAAKQYNNAADYTNFSILSAARDEGAALLAARPKADAQSMADAATQAIQNAIASLIRAADITALKAAINEVKKYAPEDAVDFSAVTAAQTAGQALLDSKPSLDQQAEVDAAAQAILNAIAALVWKSGTKRNPIAFKYASSVTKGLHYSYNGNVYLCKDSMDPCLVLPGTSSSKWEKVSV